MTVRESVSLSTLTTFKTGGAARYVIECENDEAVREALAFAREHMLPWYVLGQGSNVLASDTGYEGVLILPRASALSVEEQGESLFFIADAGYSWDTLVRAASERKAWGVENLAGIPGTVGAAPVQNIGAYGAELADTLEWVEAMNPEDGTVQRLSKEVCAFGYRDSRFKRESLIILRVALRLSKNGTPRVSYADLARLIEAGAVLNTPETIAEAVRGIRSKKFPDLATNGTAGSFFKNPVITSLAYATLQEKYPGIPGFPGASGVKISLAWILDKALSLRGFRMGHARLFEAQPLVIVADTGATTVEVETLASDVVRKVFDATGITLEWEVRTLK